MSDKPVDRKNSKKSFSTDRPLMARKKTKAELEQELHMNKQYETVIGQLKAAEARNRIRATRLRFAKSQQEEIDQIIAFQPNALSALRFEAFMSDPSLSSQKEKGSTSLHSTPRTNNSTQDEHSRDALTQIEQRRVQNLLLDDKNLLVNRID